MPRFVQRIANNQGIVNPNMWFLCLYIFLYIHYIQIVQPNRQLVFNFIGKKKSMGIQGEYTENHQQYMGNYLGLSKEWATVQTSATHQSQTPTNHCGKHCLAPILEERTCCSFAPACTENACGSGRAGISSINGSILAFAVTYQPSDQQVYTALENPLWMLVVSEKGHTMDCAVKSFWK